MHARASPKHAHGPEFLVGNDGGKPIELAAMMDSLSLAKLLVLTSQHCNPVNFAAPILILFFFGKRNRVDQLKKEKWKAISRAPWTVVLHWTVAAPGHFFLP